MGGVPRPWEVLATTRPLEVVPSPLFMDSNSCRLLKLDKLSEEGWKWMAEERLDAKDFPRSPPNGERGRLLAVRAARN